MKNIMNRISFITVMTMLISSNVYSSGYAELGGPSAIGGYYSGRSLAYPYYFPPMPFWFTPQPLLASPSNGSGYETTRLEGGKLAFEGRPVKAAWLGKGYYEYKLGKGNCDQLSTAALKNATVAITLPQGIDDASILYGKQKFPLDAVPAKAVCSGEASLVYKYSTEVRPEN